MLKIRQQIILDVLMKTLILIKSILILCYSLSFGYKNVSTNMTFYDNNLLNCVIENIRKGKCNVRKIIGLIDEFDSQIDKRKKGYYPIVDVI